MEPRKSAPCAVPDLTGLGTINTGARNFVRAASRHALLGLLVRFLPLVMLTCLCTSPAHANGVNGPIGNGQVVSGTVIGTGIDTYTFPVQAGNAIFVSVTEVGTHSYDPAINIYNPSGGRVTGTYSGYNSNLKVVGAVAGTWSVTVSVWQGASHPTQGGGYTLKVITIPGVIANAVGPMVPGTIYSGSIYRGSVDAYTFQGIAGTGLNVNITFSRTSGTFDTAIRLFGPTGTDWGGTFSGGTYTARFGTGSTTGTFTLLVYRWGSGDGTNEYTITASGSGVGVPSSNPPPSAAKCDGDCAICRQSAFAASSYPVSADGRAALGDPINVATGNVFEQATDYTTAGANPLVLTRYYNSASFQHNLYPTALGPNWRSNYDRALHLVSSTSVAAERPDGRVINFNLSGSTWTPDTDVDATLTNSGSTWTLTDDDDTVEIYTASNGKATLDSIALRNGYTQTLNYAGSELTSVSDSYNRSLYFTYTNGALTGVTTPDTATLTYGYTTVAGYSLLTSVTYNTSPSTNQTYLYENASLPFALTGVIDETGSRFATWSYDTSGRGLTSQTGTGPNANIVTISYDDATGNRTVTNALGEQDIYKFTTMQGVPKVAEIDRQATATTTAATRKFTYDANGYLVTAADWDGNTTLWTNNSHGLPTTINEAVGTTAARTTTIAYDTTFVHLPGTVTTTGLQTGFTYDGQGNVLTKTLTDTTSTTVPYATNGQTRTWTYTWSNFLLESAQSPRTDVTAKTTYSYGSDGALTSITNALHQVTAITQHTGGGLPQIIVDPNNVTTTLAYDERQRLTSSSVSTGSGARTTTYSYSTGANIQTVSLPDGSSLTNSYDSAHRLTGAADNLNDRLAWTLDANGDATQRLILDPANNTAFSRTATFDALGRELLDTSAVTGKSTTYTYDNNANALKIADPLNHTATRVFDALNRLVQVTDANSGITKFAYDPHDRPTSVTAPVGVTTFVYDGFGDVIQQKSPDSGTTVYRYDADGNLTQKVDAAGNISNHSYDALERVLTATYPADSTLNVAYSYDESGHGFSIGRLTSLTDAAGSLSRSWDERGNLLSETRVKGASTLVTNYAYDPASRIAGIAYPSGAAVAYSRDAAGRISAVAAIPPGGSSTPVLSGMGYLPFGPVNAFSFGNGIAETRTFDLDYRLGVLTDTGSSPVQKLTYGYDAANNVLTIADGVNAARNQTLGYDVIDRLISAAGAYGSLAYTYDKNGNRLTQKLGKTTTKYTYASGTNRLATITAPGGVKVTVSTNANGNITGIPPANSGAPAMFAYNAANQLATVTGSPLAGAFVYDAFGQRFSKANPGSQPTVFTYSQDGGLLEENNNGTITDYIYADGVPVATLAPATGSLSFLHTDHLGTPQLATDSSQNPVWSTAYQPFGATSLITGSITQNLRLPGQYADTETGFNHNGFRDYMPNVGRYLESDPIGLAAGPNIYGYVGQNPAMRIDPTGLDGITNPNPTPQLAYAAAIASAAASAPEPTPEVATAGQTVQEVAASPQVVAATNVNPLLRCIHGDQESGLQLVDTTSDLGTQNQLPQLVANVTGGVGTAQGVLQVFGAHVNIPGLAYADIAANAALAANNPKELPSLLNSILDLNPYYAEADLLVHSVRSVFRINPAY